MQKNNLRMKKVLIEIPEKMNKKEVEKLIKNYYTCKGNLDVLLSLRKVKVSEERLKKIEEMMEEWKESLTPR